MKPLKGKAYIDFNTKRIHVDVVFELDEGYAVVKIPSQDSEPTALLFSMYFTNPTIHLYDVWLNSPIGNLHADKLGPFITSSRQISPGLDSSIIKSSLAKLLAVSPDVREIDEIRLRPTSSNLKFELESEPTLTDSEILYFCPLSRDVSFNLSQSRISIQSHSQGGELADHIRVTSKDLRLTDRERDIRTTISLLLRRRASLRAIRDGNFITLNLSKPDSTTSLSPLVASQHYGDACERLLSHIEDNKSGSRKFSYYFLIEATSNPAALEVRLTNAFIYLECIDESDTLDGNRLMKILGIPREEADALIKFRHALIHEGLNVNSALTKSRQRLATQGPPRKAQILEDVFQTSSPHGMFYCALMDLLFFNLSKLTQIPEYWIQRTSTVQFSSSR